MKPCIAALACVLVAASIVVAQPGDLQGPPPGLKVVSAIDKTKGLIEFIETVTKAVPVQKAVVKEIIVVKNGVQVKETVTETVIEYVFVEERTKVVIDAAKSRVITPDGKQLPIDEVWKRVKANTVVAVSGNANTPAQAYLRALSAETLVIIPGNEPMVPPVPK